MSSEKEKDPYRLSRLLYIVEAALEYFISILVGEAYLAKVSNSIGISDAATGILSSFVSLGCMFQIVAVFLSAHRPVKRWVTVLHTVNQLCFALLYVMPGAPLSRGVKTAAFVLLLLLGHVLSQVVYSPKINWYMSLVKNDRRGRFTANKEIVSLMSGMIFSFFMGNMIDRFEAAGDLNGAFTLVGVTIFALALLHTATLLFSREKPDRTPALSVGKSLRALVQNRTVFVILLVSVLWHVADYSTRPFYGTYRNNELGFSMTFHALLSALYSIVRSLFSRPLGRYADRRSFTRMLTVCFSIQAAAFLVNLFTVPENGKVFYTVYYLLNAVAMAGINSGTINLIYDYVGVEMRTGALALQGTLAGTAGFLTTLAASVPVSLIQKNGNTLFGLPIYAQQFQSAVGLAVVIGILIYLNTVVKKVTLVRGADPDTASV